MILTNHKIKDNGIWISKSELEKWYNHYTKTAVQLSKTKIEMAMYYAGISDVLFDMVKAIENNKE